MLNHGRLTNEELINLLAITRHGLEDPSDCQVKKWNKIHDKAAEEISRRLDTTSPTDSPEKD